MTQPSFVPISEADQVRAARRLHVPGSWHADRPAELRVPLRPGGRSRGTPGPDQGYALRLARRFEERLHLVPGESAPDVVTGCALLGSRRSALFGRAPSTFDLEVAFHLFAFLDEAAPEGLVHLRRRLFDAVSHDYDAQRALVDRVPETTLRLAPAQVATADRLALLGVPAAGAEGTESAPATGAPEASGTGTSTG